MASRSICICISAATSATEPRVAGVDTATEARFE